MVFTKLPAPIRSLAAALWCCCWGSSSRCAGGKTQHQSCYRQVVRSFTKSTPPPPPHRQQRTTFSRALVRRLGEIRLNRSAPLFFAALSTLACHRLASSCELLSPQNLAGSSHVPPALGSYFSEEHPTALEQLWCRCGDIKSCLVPCRGLAAVQPRKLHALRPYLQHNTTCHGLRIHRGASLSLEVALAQVWRLQLSLPSCRSLARPSADLREAASKAMIAQNPRLDCKSHHSKYLRPRSQLNGLAQIC
jgi:hypothetical protein